ncbi:MAG: hypothetical protein KGH98_02705 [Candidatus Micrarchaeota archaeon]|nr:hypothetical protein [Candidatus Micrarchaeota archaeon]
MSPTPLYSYSDAAIRVKRSDIVYRHMRDPALLRHYYAVKTIKEINGLSLAGSSPTDIFVGRFGYPKVSIGPLVPPEFGDTTILGTPERWRFLNIEQIVDFRSKLVRGMQEVRVTDTEKPGLVEKVQELAMADGTADSEMDFIKRPRFNMTLRDEVQPFGPSGTIKSFDMGDVRSDQKIESRFSDADADAKTSVVELYEKGVPVSKIQKAFSAGLFGLKQRRKFVPTRWSITAVDDTLSKNTLEEVKSYEPVDSIYAYYNCALDNRWLIFFMPGNWQYESIEAWWPKTVWNENGKDISIYGSYEGWEGRKTYAEIGGCYYSGRLAITERMKILKRQGVALILREVHDGYIMPVGVWNVREHVRETLSTKPETLENTQQMFDYIKGKLEIGTKEWIRNSRILKDMLTQRRIPDFVKP